MMSFKAFRGLVILALVLAAGTFAYVLLAAPIDPERSPRARALTQRPPITTSTDGVREHLVAKRYERAISLARDIVDAYPQSAPALLELAQALELSGDSEGAQEQWTNLLTLLPAEDPDYRPSLNTMYYRARALRALGEVVKSYELFLMCARLELSSAGFRSSYNAACYLAMGGAHSAALQEWENALGLGTGPGSGRGSATGVLDDWWRVDPDLDPIRGEQRFWDAADQAGLLDARRDNPEREPQRPLIGT